MKPLVDALEIGVMLPPQIEVWWAHRRQHAWGHLIPLLDRAERTRLDALRREEDRERFVLSAATTRAAVAQRLGVTPSAVKLDRTCRYCGKAHGKPRLTMPAAPLELSITHAGDVAGVAVSSVGRVGLDVEHLCRLLDSFRLERRVLSDRERQAVSRIATATRDHSAARAEACLRLWTRKEAIVKMTGDGLNVPFDRLVVSDPDEPPRLLSWTEGGSDLCRVSLHDLPDPAPRHVASLASEASTPRLIIRNASKLLSRHDSS